MLQVPLWAQTVSIKVGEHVTADLPMQGSHSYMLDVQEGQFIYGIVDQQTVDVVVTIYDPGDAQIARYDNPARGPEPFQFRTSETGRYRLEVTPFREETGMYEIEVRLQQPLAQTPEGKVDQLMAMYDEDTPGSVVAVVEDGEIIFSKGYGNANLEYRIPNTPSTPYHVASVSKQFTAYAIAMLAHQGKLTLEDDVRTYIPELHDFGETITLRHLANHTSGLRDQWTLWAMSGGVMDDVIRQEDLFGLIERQEALNFSPGAEYMYSNSGYLLLATVVERVTGEAFGDWMRANIFEPLDMHATQIYDDHERIVEGRAYSYRDGAEGIQKAVLSYANSGATSLFTTVEDLAKWLRNMHTTTVGAPEVWTQMQERGILANGDTLGYALGIGVGEYRGLRRLQHGGADAGYRTILSYYPEIDAGVIVFSNVASFNMRMSPNRIAEIFFEDHMAPRETANPAEPETSAPQKEPWKPDTSELEAYTGWYFSPELETYYTIVLDEDQLIAEHRRHGRIALSPEEQDTFSGSAWFFSDIAFDRDEAGGVAGMHVSSGRVRNLRFEKQE